jgi:hypothetical protein
MKGTLMSKSSRLSLLLLLCVSGCTLFSKGHTHAEYDLAAHKMVMTKAAKSEQYALYVNNDPIPAAVQILKKGEMLGFEQNDEERIRAVAGDYSTILPRGATVAKWSPLAMH